MEGSLYSCWIEGKLPNPLAGVFLHSTKVGKISSSVAAEIEMILGINDLRHAIQNCPIGFVRLGLSFTALWATHLKPASILKPRALSRQLNLFKLCLSDFRTNFYNLSRSPEGRIRAAECKALLRTALFAAKEEFDNPVLDDELPEGHPPGWRWYDAIAGCEWPDDWGSAKDLPPSRHLEDLFELCGELYRDVLPERHAAAPRAEPQLGAFIGLYLLQAFSILKSGSPTEKNISIAQRLHELIQQYSSGLGWDLRIPEANDCDGIERARIQLTVGLRLLPKFKWGIPDAVPETTKIGVTHGTILADPLPELTGASALKKSDAHFTPEKPKGIGSEAHECLWKCALNFKNEFFSAKKLSECTEGYASLAVTRKWITALRRDGYLSKHNQSDRRSRVNYDKINQKS